jgi:hypothetical protein
LFIPRKFAAALPGRQEWQHPDIGIKRLMRGLLPMLLLLLPRIPATLRNRYVACLLHLFFVQTPSYTEKSLCWFYAHTL